MTMEPVEGSSSISEMGYDAETKTLRVKFHNGGLYDFENISPEKHKTLVDSPSKGKHFMTHIRHHHEFRRID